MPKNKREIDHSVKKLAICTIAYNLFVEQGYEGTSMAAIAEALGVSQNTLYWYFSNKDQLLMDVVDARIQSVMQGYSLLQDGSVSGRLQWLLDQVHGSGALINVVHGRVSASPEVRQWHQGLHQKLQGLFTERLVTRGVPAAQADVIVQTAMFAFEGVATHPTSSDSAAKVFAFIESAVDAATQTSARQLQA
jgi:AcrR family transcriptional regulator